MEQGIILLSASKVSLGVQRGKNNQSTITTHALTRNTVPPTARHGSKEQALRAAPLQQQRQSQRAVAAAPTSPLPNGGAKCDTPLQQRRFVPSLPLTTGSRKCRHSSENLPPTSHKKTASQARPSSPDNSRYGRLSLLRRRRHRA